MTTHESIQFHHDMASIVEGNKAKGIDKAAAARIAKEGGDFEAAYLEARRNQRKATRAIRLIDYDQESGKKIKKLDKKATKEREAALEERRETQQVFVTTHKAFKKFLQEKIDAAAGVAAIKKALGVKISEKLFTALAELWQKHTGFRPRGADAEKADKPAKRGKIEKKPGKKGGKKSKDESDDEASDSSDDESSDESDDSSDDDDADEKPAKKGRKLARKPDKKEKPVKRAKPTKKRVVEDSDDGDDEDVDLSDD